MTSARIRVINPVSIVVIEGRECLNTHKPGQMLTNRAPKPQELASSAALLPMMIDLTGQCPPGCRRTRRAEDPRSSGTPGRLGSTSGHGRGDRVSATGASTTLIRAAQMAQICVQVSKSSAPRKAPSWRGRRSRNEDVCNNQKERISGCPLGTGMSSIHSIGITL